MQIGLKLRSLREERGMSQGDIEKPTGLLRCYLSRVENGHTVPALETLEKIANAMNVPMHMLFFDGPGEPKPLKLHSGKRPRTNRQIGQAAELEKRMARMNKRDRNLLLMLATKMAKGAQS